MISDANSVDITNNKSKDVSDITNYTNLSNLGKGGKADSHNFLDLSDHLKRGVKKNQKKNIYCDNLEILEENIYLVRKKFFEKSENIRKEELFREKYAELGVEGSYIEILLLMKEFPEFNLFDYMNVDLSSYSKSKVNKKKLAVIRNNIFLRVLIEASLAFSDRRDDMALFEDLSFLRPHIEAFKNILCERDRLFTLEIDVEVFFLSILGYKDKALAIVIKFYDYFNNFLKDFSESDSTKKIFENLDNISEKDFSELMNEELIVFRKIINNCAQRKFYRGIQFLCENELFCNCMTEGRIWKSMIKYLPTEETLIIWSIYFRYILETKQPLRFTIDIEYAKRLQNYQDDNPKDKYEKEEKEKEIQLESVMNLKSFLVIAFKVNRNDMALEVINFTKRDGKFSKLINVEIFNICLEFDEDITIELLDVGINSDTAKDYHIKLALIKKYFRLACKLLKYKVCKNFLNQKKINDSDDYMFIMNRFQLQEKKKMYANVEKEGFKDRNEMNQNYMKLLSIASDFEEDKKEGESVREETNVDFNIKQEDISERGAATNFNLNTNPEQNQISDDHREKMKQISFKSADHNEKSKLFKDFKQSTNKSIKGYNTIIDTMKVMMKKDTQKYSNDSSCKANHQGDFDDKSLFNPDKEKNTLEKKQTDQEIEMINFVNKKSTGKGTPGIHVEYAGDGSTLKKQKSNRIIKSMISYHNSDLGASGFHQNSVMNEESRAFNNSVNKQNSKEIHQKSISFQDLIKLNKPINSQMILIDHLRWGQYTFYCICLLNSISERYLNTEYSEKICKSLLVFTRDEEAISRSRYPLILCVIAAEFLIKLGKINSKYQYKCQSIASMFLQMAECLQNSIKDEEMLNYFLREQTDYKKRSALEIIAENRFYELLNDENVATMVGKLWYGTGKDMSILKFCRITRILGASIRHEHYNDVVSRDIKNKTFSFQYAQYTNNCSVRYLVDSVSTVMTTILYQFIIYIYVSISKQGNIPDNDPYFATMNLVANFIVISINLNLIMYLVYVYLTNRKLQMSFFIFLDFLMFVAVLFNFLKVPSIVFGNDTINVNFFDAVIYSVIIFCAWMRVIGILMTTRSFGPFLRIIYLLMSTFFNFLLVLYGLNTVFAQVFTILFKNTNSDFDSFFDSWITLFRAIFGITYFTDFTIMKIFGYVLLTIYTVITNVMLLNLMVAIINNLFFIFSEKADAENRAVLVLTYERIKWDDEYGLLILLPAPFNIISFPLSLILIGVRDVYKAKLNMIFSKACYIMVALGNFMILLLSSLLLLPFAYVKSLLHSGYEGLGKMSLTDIPYVLFHIVTRPLIFLFYIVEDIKIFWSLCYEDDKDENKEDEKNIVNKDIILALRKVIFDYRFAHKKKIIHIKDLYSKLGLNKKKRASVKLMTSPSPDKNNSSFSGSDSDNSGDNLSNNDNNSNSNERSNSIPLGTVKEDTVKTELLNLSKLTDVGTKTCHAMTSFERNLAFKFLIDKIVDKDGFVDIERTLFILPERAKYNTNFLKNLKYLHMRVVLRGLQKYFFLNAVINPVYSYKKLQQLIYKILIKFKMVYYFLPDNQMNQAREGFNTVNDMKVFSKDYDNLVRMEQNDECSDFDDQGIFDEFLKSSYLNSSQKTNTLTNVNQSQEISPKTEKI